MTALPKMTKLSFIVGYILLQDNIQKNLSTKVRASFIIPTSGEATRSTVSLYASPAIVE